MARRRNGVRIYANSGQSLVDGSNVPETLDHAAPRQSTSPPTDSAASSQIPAFSTSSRTSTEQIYVFLRGGILEPSEDCSRVIRRIFEERQDYEGFTWKNVSKETKMFYSLEFEKYVCWDDEIYTPNQVWKAWKKKAGLRYNNMLKDIKDGGVKPKYMEDDTYECWLKYWDTPEAKRKSEQNSKNRRSGSTSASAPAPSTHNAGSITHFKAAQKLAVILGRKPFPREVYIKTHTKKGDGMTFINEKSKKVNDIIEANRVQLIQNNEEIDEDKLYFDSVGGLSRKKVVYGLGSVACEYFRINTASFVTHELEGQQIIRDLKRRLDEQDKLIEELQRQNEIQQRKNVEDMQRQIDERIRAMIGAP